MENNAQSKVNKTTVRKKQLNITVHKTFEKEN